MLYLLPHKPADCDEQIAKRREELGQVPEDLADGHLWAERCRETIREVLEARPELTVVADA